jgi:hypothetical protein
MVYLCDTNILIEYLRGNAQIRDRALYLYLQVVASISAKRRPAVSVNGTCAGCYSVRINQTRRRDQGR